MGSLSYTLQGLVLLTTAFIYEQYESLEEEHEGKPAMGSDLCQRRKKTCTSSF